jgi:hypothetical protein
LRVLEREAIIMDTLSTATQRRLVEHRVSYAMMVKGKTCPMFSVIIPTYNRASFVTKAVMAQE